MHGFQLDPHAVLGVAPGASHEQVRDAYRQKTGRWPNERSGPIAEAPGETWNAVANALGGGGRGLPGGSSLGRLLREHRCPGEGNRSSLLSPTNVSHHDHGNCSTAPI